MIAGENSLLLPGEVEQLRARARRCRSYAREYAPDVGACLAELAAELDGQADRLAADAARVERA